MYIVIPIVIETNDMMHVAMHESPLMAEN